MANLVADANSQIYAAFARKGGQNCIFAWIFLFKITAKQHLI